MMHIEALKQISASIIMDLFWDFYGLIILYDKFTLL